MTRLLLTTITLTAMLAGCPGDDDGSADDRDGGSRGRADMRVCDAHSAWEARCPDEDDDPAEPLWGDAVCPTEFDWSYVEPALIEAQAECLADLPCTSSDDACAEPALQAVGIDDPSDVENDPLFQACLDRHDACPAADDFIDDTCTVVLAYTDAGRRAAEHCLELECDHVGPCLRAPDAH